ncbi:MAG: hypothetical protein JSV80_08405 [Acidobacteriota bacterium]|nr:MAG: hypothetical protein JSV80_08405 [Acidobacteriota bacterium]
MLFITNGDVAAEALERCHLADEIVPWRDVLHEGPVPEGLSLRDLSELRARFIASENWADLDEAIDQFERRDGAIAAAFRHDEIVLWFEHDLCDQLQMVQALDALAKQLGDPAKCSLVCNAEYLGGARAEHLARRFAGRQTVTAEQLTRASTAWAAFRAPDPRRISEWLAGDAAAFPFLQAALERHLQQFPWARDGLSRTERQALRAIETGRDTPREAFACSHLEQEDPVFLGDIVFLRYLERLMQRPNALLRFASEAVSGSSLPAKSPSGHLSKHWDTPLELTETGVRILEGHDRVAICGIDRWLGGVHLEGRNGVWRWNESRRRLEQPS